jgi:Mn2+/Fe2+ NRAMP family transporter
MEKTVDDIKMPPTGLAILTLVGPGLVWAGEYIGSGEVILCTRLGSIMGVTILWVPMIAIFLKYWIGLCGARYTVCVGEGMMDMFSRMPGPRNWAIWVVLVGQFSAGAVSIGGLASASAAFIHALWPVDQVITGWAVSLICVLIVWSGKFDPLKYVTSALVLIMVIGVIYVAVRVAPGLSELMVGLFGFGLPEVPAWALDSGVASKNVWAELLPVMGWAAGGFASQVWYTYWVLESGYGMASVGGFGQAAGEKELSEMNVETARKLKGWSHVVYVDATTAVMVGMVVTGSFLVAGAGVLGKLHLAPNGPQVAIQLSEIFGRFWGRTGAILFLLAGIAALVSTNLCQFAGWPRIMSDCARILFPRSVEKFPPQRVRRIFVLIFLTSNMLIINTFGVQPVMLVKVGAILDGLLLTPLQAILVGWALFVTMPRLLSRDAARTLKASPVLAVGLAIAALVFSYFAVVKIPTILY